uniref:Gag-pol polyprotein n=1 Tax=Solanum tuberosum TaxID=4113 RepID=M1DTS1_SOLTU
MSCTWFFPRELREAKAKEFMNMRQGSMSVQEYGLMFTLLSRDNEVTTVGLNLQLQQHQQISQLGRVLHLVQVANSSRTGYPKATLSFVTLYIAMNFDVSPETLSEPFSVSTLVDDPVIARQLDLILHAQYLSSTNADSALRLLVM